jgi:hypothetical protein
VLEIGGDAGELAEEARELAILEGLDVRVLDDHGLSDDEFSDEVDEGVEFLSVEFDEIGWSVGLA